MSKRNKFLPEVIIAILGAVIGFGSTFFGLNLEISVLVAVVSWTISLAAASIKYAILSQYNSFASEFLPTIRHTEEVMNLLNDAEGRRLSLLKDELRTVRNSARKIVDEARISITDEQYFERLVDTVQNLVSGDVLLSTSILGQWSADQSGMQRLYMATHNKAIERGVTVRRVFILDRLALGKPEYKRGFEEVKRQLESNDIDASIVWREEAKKLKAEMDLVLIKSKATGRRAFLGIPHVDFPFVITRAEECFEEFGAGAQNLDDLEERFNRLKKRKIDDRSALEQITKAYSFSWE